MPRSRDDYGFLSFNVCSISQNSPSSRTEHHKEKYSMRNPCCDPRIYSMWTTVGTRTLRVSPARILKLQTNFRIRKPQVERSNLKLIEERKDLMVCELPWTGRALPAAPTIASFLPTTTYRRHGLSAEPSIAVPGYTLTTRQRTSVNQ